MSERKPVSTGYEPRPLQAELHKKLRRFSVLVMHRRFGKSVFGLNHMIDRALRNPLKNPQYAYMAPYYGQVKRIAWDYAKQYTSQIPGVAVNEADLRIDIPRPWISKTDRIRILLLGADNPESLKGIYLDGAVLDEYGKMNPTVWREVIRPTLSDRHVMNPESGWAIISGTPAGMNHFHEMYEFSESEMNPDRESWFRAMYKASETGIIPPMELRSLKASMSEEEYEQEFECSWASGVLGAYYAKLIVQAEDQKRITQVPYDPSLPVTCAWDLGIGDSTAIWFFQELGPRVHVIDYEEHSGLGLDGYAKLLAKKGYHYSNHILPHDAAAKDLSTGKTRQQFMYSLGISPSRILPRLAVDDRIASARALLPKCWFDAEKCARGIKALRNYSREWDGKLGIFKSAPKHDWASHGSDSFGYGAQGLSGRGAPGQYAQRNLQQSSIDDYNVFTHANEDRW
jgi:phage terminase large subunit